MSAPLEVFHSVLPYLTVVSYAVAGYILFNFVYGFVHGIFARCIRGGKNLKKCYGEWAVVTGATDGIGKAMAFEMAKKGLNILLISRTQSKLDDCQAELKKKYKVEVRTLAVDYSNFDKTAREKVASAVQSMDVGVLVNNVGVSYPYTQYFHELEDISVQQLMTLNIDSATWMTRIVLPGMIAKRKGSVVNISSAAGVTTSPLLSQYGAAKSYIAMFSKAMYHEYKKYNIHFQCQVPLYVCSKLSKFRKPSTFIITAEQYAKSAIACIGYENVVSPYWSHAFQMWFIQNLPEWLIVKMTRDMHLAVRKKARKKEGKSD